MNMVEVRQGKIQDTFIKQLDNYTLTCMFNREKQHIEVLLDDKTAFSQYFGLFDNSFLNAYPQLKFLSEDLSQLFLEMKKLTWSVGEKGLLKLTAQVGSKLKHFHFKTEQVKGNLEERRHIKQEKRISKLEQASEYYKSKMNGLELKLQQIIVWKDSVVSGQLKQHHKSIEKMNQMLQQVNNDNLSLQVDIQTIKGDVVSVKSQIDTFDNMISKSIQGLKELIYEHCQQYDAQSSQTSIKVDDQFSHVLKESIRSLFSNIKTQMSDYGTRSSLSALLSSQQHLFAQVQTLKQTRQAFDVPQQKIIQQMQAQTYGLSGQIDIISKQLRQLKNESLEKVKNLSSAYDSGYSRLVQQMCEIEEKVNTSISDQLREMNDKLKGISKSIKPLTDQHQIFESNPLNMQENYFQKFDTSFCSITLKLVTPLVNWKCVAGGSPFPKSKASILFFNIKTAQNKQIMIGICTKNAIGTENTYNHEESLNYFCLYGDLHGSGLSHAAGGRAVSSGEVVTLKVDLKEHIIAWKVGTVVLKSLSIPEKMRGQQVYWLLSMHRNGDIVTVSR